ncbi:hypothetical protein YA0002_11455 [Pseudomonas cichorii]|nr:hypothetical protein [Pseudomonas cichorii]
MFPSIPFKSRTERVKSPFADFIRNAKSDEKKRVYSAVLVEATRLQREVMEASRAETA